MQYIVIDHGSVQDTVLPDWDGKIFRGILFNSPEEAESMALMQIEKAREQDIPECYFPKFTIYKIEKVKDVDQ